MAKVKRSQFATFLNVVPGGTASYKLIGVGVTAGEIAYNPNIVTETYIHEDSGNAEVEGYAPTMPIEAAAVNGDDVFEFIDGLRKSRAILDDAHTDIINVWLYETPTGSVYPAEKQNVTIAIESFGGEGGSSSKINYSINYRGDRILGTFNTSTFAFTAT